MSVLVLEYLVREVAEVEFTFQCTLNGIHNLGGMVVILLTLEKASPWRSNDLSSPVELDSFLSK